MAESVGHHRVPRDRGHTVVEMVVTMALLGVIMSVVALGARVVVTTDRPMMSRLSTAQDLITRSLASPSTPAPSSTTPTNTDPVPVVLPVPHPCRGGVALLIDTSTSVYSQGAATSMVAGVRALLDALTGSAMRVRIVTFDLLAATLAPTGTNGAQVSLLTSSTTLSALRASVEALDDSASTWKAGSNWEDGLWQAVRRDSGTIFPALPDLVLMITDGVPTRNRTNTSTDGDNTFHQMDLTRAVTAADYARSTGASLAGIVVGTGTTATALDYLRMVIGPEVTSGSFADLPALGRDVVRARCGAALTVVPRSESGGVLGPTNGIWSLAIDGATHTIDATLTPAFTITPGASVATFTVTATGQTITRIECSANNAPVLTSTVFPVTVPMHRDTTTSCQILTGSP